MKLDYWPLSISAPPNLLITPSSAAWIAGVWIHAPRGPATAVVSPQPPCNNLKLADFDAQGQKDQLVLASILAFGVALPFVLSP